MVFNVSGNLEKEEKVVDKQWEASAEDGLVCKTKPYVIKHNTCCVILPWFFLCLSLVMLGCVASWGWKEHTKLKDIMKQQKEACKPHFLAGEMPPLNIPDDDDIFLNTNPEQNFGKIDDGGLMPDEIYGISDEDDVGDEATTAAITTTPTTESPPERHWFIFRLLPFFRPSDDGNNAGPRPSFMRFHFTGGSSESVPDEEKSGGGAAESAEN